MKSLILFLLILQATGTFITIPPLGHYTEETSIAGKDFIHYQVNASSFVSILIMDSFQHYQYENHNPYTYDYNCSRFCLTSIDVSCVHDVDVSYHQVDYPVYFVIQNDLNSSVDVSYTLENTEDHLLLLLGGFFGGILAIIVVAVGVEFTRKRCVRREFNPNYDYMVY